MIKKLIFNWKASYEMKLVLFDCDITSGGFVGIVLLVVTVKTEMTLDNEWLIKTEWTLDTKRLFSHISLAEGLAQWLRSLPPNPEVPSSIPGLI